MDAATTASITGGIGSLSVDQVNWGSSVTILPTNYTLYVRQNASTGSGGLAQLSYRIGNTADVNGDAIIDTFRVYTRQFNILGDFITENTLVLDLPTTLSLPSPLLLPTNFS